MCRSALKNGLNCDICPRIPNQSLITLNCWHSDRLDPTLVNTLRLWGQASLVSSFTIQSWEPTFEEGYSKTYSFRGRFFSNCHLWILWIKLDLLVNPQIVIWIYLFADWYWVLIVLSSVEFVSFYVYIMLIFTFLLNILEFLFSRYCVFKVLYYYLVCHHAFM